MRKHAAFWGALIVVGLVLATLFGCKGPAHVYAKVCADTEAKPVVRAADSRCEESDTDDRFRWRYYEPQVWIDPVGKPLFDKKYWYAEPDDSETLYRIPEDKGGTAYSVKAAND